MANEQMVIANKQLTSERPSKPVSLLTDDEINVSYISVVRCLKCVKFMPFLSLVRVFDVPSRFVIKSV